MSTVSAFYTSVIKEVIETLKKSLTDVDPATFNDLKDLWEKKIKDSGALEVPKHSQVPSASQFTAMMQKNGALDDRMSRNNAGSRLIQRTSQSAIVSDQSYAARLNLPVYQVQTGVPYHTNTIVPMILNPHHQGMAVFSQYHNIVSNQGNVIHAVPDSGIINLRKNQTDGVDSSDEEGGDFVNVSEADPHSVRPTMTPKFKKEEIAEDSDDELVDHELDAMDRGIVQPKKENDDSDDDEEDEDEDKEQDLDEEAPLNSGDDISDDDPERIFESENVIVCQYDKVSRTRNKWKLNFVSGIATLHGKDTVFHKATGEAEW